MPLPNRKPAIKRKKIKTVREHRQFRRKLDNAIQKTLHGSKPAAAPPMKSPRSAKINAMKAKLKKQQAKK